MSTKLSVLLLFAVMVTGCTSARAPLSQYPSEPNALTEAAYQSELRAVASDIASRLITICRRPDLLAQAAAASQPSSAIERCYREKIENAFNEPEGVTACADMLSPGSHFVCVAMGSYLNDLRRNIGSPKYLSQDEWRDADLAVKNTNAEIIVQSLVTCAKSGSEGRESCEENFLLRAFSLDALSGDICKRQAEVNNCLMHKSIVAFMRNRAVLIW